MGWKIVSNLSDLADGQVKNYILGDRDIAVAKVADEYFAFDNTCTHRKCPLSEGYLETGPGGVLIECSCHGAQFDLRSGAVLRLPAVIPLRIYPVKVEGGKVWVEV